MKALSLYTCALGFVAYRAEGTIAKVLPETKLPAGLASRDSRSIPIPFCTMSIRSAISVPFMSVGWRLFIWIPLNVQSGWDPGPCSLLTSLNYNGGIVGDCSQLLRFRIIVRLEWQRPARRGVGSRKRPNVQPQAGELVPKSLSIWSPRCNGGVQKRAACEKGGR